MDSRFRESDFKDSGFDFNAQIQGVWVQAIQVVGQAKNNLEISR